MTGRAATEDQAPAPFDRLVGREVGRVREELERAHPRALSENPEGNALVAGALRDALRLGLEAGCRRAKTPVDELDYGHPDAWERWQGERARSPEGLGWPGELEATTPDAVAAARELVADPGADLGLRRRALRRFADAGAEVAEAGAALARALTAPSPVPEAPATATSAALGAPQPDGSVRVAMAANQAEAELLQGVLADAGIPSTWRRTGGDLPDLLAAGYREIYVPAAAADQAQALLATLEDSSPADDEPEPTRRIGLERTGLRLIGKWAAALVVASLVASTVLGVVTDNAALGIALFLAILVAAGAAVLWSERAGHT
jgi:hypothetical protein